MASTKKTAKPSAGEADLLAPAQFSRGADTFNMVEFTPRQMIERIAKVYLKPLWRVLIVSLAAMTFMAATTGALPFLMQQVADKVFVAKDERLLFLLPVLVICIMTLRAAADYISRVTLAQISNEVVGALRIDMFKSLTRADLSYLEAMHSGRFIAAFMSDVGLVNKAAAGTLTALVKNGLTALFLVGAMIWLDWFLALLVLMGAPFAIYFMSKQRRKIRDSTRGMLQETGDFSSLIAQMLRGVRIIKAYGQEEQEEARFVASIRRVIGYLMRQARAQSSMGPATEALTGVGFAAAILYGGWQGIAGNVTLGSFMGFMTAAMLAYQPLKALAALQGQLTQGTEAAKRVFTLIDHAPEVNDDKSNGELTVENGEIIFENVCYSYDGETQVLEDFSLVIPAGKKVALVGPSGSGKTTLMNLTMRFFDPTSGRILIDGQDVSLKSIASVRAATALLTQDPVLFDDTIQSNIEYGMENISEDELHSAARAAAAHDFIKEFPNGYATEVGEAGALLSGGQKQRVAIARALLKSAPILLLDEPTSALDPGSEAKIQNALETLFAGRTVMMIAHRLTTVKDADLICVLDQGQLAESGTHSELMSKNGLYAAFCRNQSGDNVSEGMSQDTVDA
ncbi:MAG: ABC transporter transmembrane domain-containing protein [Hyphomicrobiales bacterium]